MRILLVAYEFPPSPSPQSLRWAYLARELATLGNEVHVLAPHLPGDSVGLPELPEGVVVDRISAGPIVGLIAERSRPHLDSGPKRATTGMHPFSGQGRPTVQLNWKGRLFHRIKAVAGFLQFPDIRGEWTRGLRRVTADRITALRPDVVVTSHEPANTLHAGLLASRLGVPWVADLGDPVLAGYTPWRWRRRAWSLERKVWRIADAVTVTTHATADMLSKRHGPGRGPCEVLPQGYDGGELGTDASGLFEQSNLELLYTGSFYHFRNPAALIDAVTQSMGTRLTIASMKVPDEVVAAAKRYPDKLRLLGFLRHDDVLALQRSADVLVNIGNLDPCQVPGKLFEYLGSGRPVLHLGTGSEDEAARLVTRAGAGWVCENEAAAVLDAISTLRIENSAGRLGTGLARNSAVLECYRWNRIAEKYESVLEAAVRRHGRNSSGAVHMIDTIRQNH